MATSSPAKRRILWRLIPCPISSMALWMTWGKSTQMALVQMQESVPHRYPQR
jgi:hypothetical protein